MKKLFLLILLSLSLFLVACSSGQANKPDDKKPKETSSNKDPGKKEVEKDPNKSIGRPKETKVVKSLFGEGMLEDKEYSNVIALLEYLDDDSYQLKLRIEQKDHINFTTENQNVYADIVISSKKLDNSSISYEKDINDKSLYKIPLIDNEMPEVTEFLIDQNSELLSEEEHKAIKNKDSDLVVSVQLRDPQGFILEISNIIISEKGVPAKMKVK